MDENQHNPDPVEKKRESPKDAVSLYMECRQAMLDAVDEYELYRKMMSTINNGSALLPEESELKKEVQRIISSRESYLPKRKMEITADNEYAMTTVKDDTAGNIRVRPEELEKGERCILNQQATVLLLKLRPTENAIYKELIDSKVLRVRILDYMDSTDFNLKMGEILNDK